jgi:DNA-binding MarR family transcriptional regulator
MPPDAPTEDAAANGPLSEMICFDLYAASRSVTAVYRPLLEPLGLTYPQYLVMVVLWRQGPSTVRDLVDALRLDYNTLSPLLKRLETQGLLTRRRRVDDERTVEIALTDEGVALRERASDISSCIGAAVGLDAPDFARLQQLLRTVTESATAYNAANAER